MATTKDELLEYLKEQIEYEKDSIASGSVDDSDKKAMDEIIKLRKFIKWVEPRKILDI